MLTGASTVKQLHIQHYIKTVHFWLKYNDLAIVRKTTKLIEGGHRGLQDIRYYFYVFLRFFQNPKSRDFYVFWRVLYVFSNYEGYLDIPHRIKE